MAKKKNEKNDTEEGAPEFYVVTDELDLHGFFPEQIPEMIEEFIRNAQDLGIEKVRIVHGKGKSRLKHVVHKCLKDNKAVVQFGDAPTYAGGWGATIALLELKQKGGP